MRQLIDIIYKTEPVVFTHHKIVFSGQFAEYFHFSRPLILNRRPTKVKKPIRPELLTLDLYFSRVTEYQKRRVTRAYSQIVRLIECNFGFNSVFLTLTFAKNFQDMREAIRLLHIFCIRLRRIYPNFKYVAVPEFQKRGSIHFHMIINQHISTEFILDYWRHGLNRIIRITNCKGVGVYFSKYLTKNSIDSRLSGFHSYYASRNLRRPKIFYDYEAYQLSVDIRKYGKMIFSRSYQIPDFSKSKRPTDEDMPSVVVAEKFDISSLLPIDLSRYSR